MRTFLSYLFAASLTLLATLPGFAEACSSTARDWYVSATSGNGGDGSKNKPFNTLAAVQAASCPGDTIYLIPAAPSVPALAGGIVLQDNQKLIGTGSDVTKLGPSSPRVKITSAGGDAITLANNNTVKNIHVIDPFGAAVLAVNREKGELSQLLITKTITNLRPRLTADLCFIATNPDGTVDNDNSTLVGCVAPYQPGFSRTLRKWAINLLTQTVDSQFTLKDIIVEDQPDLTVLTGLWGGGVLIKSSGTTVMTVDAKNITVKRTSVGLNANAIDKSKLVVTATNINVSEVASDGVTAFTGHACAGLPPDTVVFGPTCQETFGGPIPNSAVDLTFTLLNYVYKGARRGANDIAGFAVEVGAQEQGTSRLEFHMENADISKAPSAAFDLELPASSLKAGSIIDLGCVSADCKAKGYTSAGKNRFYNNGEEALISVFGPDRENQVGNLKGQLVLNGGPNTIVNNVLYAQNNDWGGLTVDPSTCVKLDGITFERVGTLPPNPTCMYWGSYLNEYSDYFDARFPK